MAVPQRVIETQHMPTIKVEKLPDQVGFKASCPALPSAGEVQNDSQIIATQLMRSKVRDFVISGQVDLGK